MNYQTIYECLVNKAQNRDKPMEYTEKHHIIPRCIGGTDSEANIVIFTAREHFVAHQLLAKIYGGGLYHAANMMSNMGRYGSKKYSWLREAHAKRLSVVITNNKERGRKISLALKGKPKTEEHRRNISLGSIRSDEQKLMQSKTMTGKKYTNEVNATKASPGEKNGMFGKAHSNEAKRKISEANKQKVDCPHCDKSGGIAIMKRWHFDRCKSK